MRWAQLKQRLWAHGRSRGSSKSSRQIGQVSSDSSVSIFRRSGVGTSAKSREADQLSENGDTTTTQLLAEATQHNYSAKQEKVNYKLPFSDILCSLK